MSDEKTVLVKDIINIFKERGIIYVNGNFAPEFKHFGKTPKSRRDAAPHPNIACKQILKLIGHTGYEDKDGNIID